VAGASLQYSKIRKDTRKVNVAACKLTITYTEDGMAGGKVRLMNQVKIKMRRRKLSTRIFQDYIMLGF